MGCIKQKLRNILGKIKGYIWQKLWDIFGKNYWIYWAKTIGYIMGYIRQNAGIYLDKLWDILDINMGNIKGYNWQYLQDRLGKNYGI